LQTATEYVCLEYINPSPPPLFHHHHHHLNPQLQTPPPPTTATISFLRTLFTRASSPATMSATKTKVQSIIDENPVAVFSKSYCPYCTAAKRLLSESGAKFFAIELDQVGMYNVTPTIEERSGQGRVIEEKRAREIPWAMR